MIIWHNRTGRDTRTQAVSQVSLRSVSALSKLRSFLAPRSLNHFIIVRAYFPFWSFRYLCILLQALTEKNVSKVLVKIDFLFQLSSALLRRVVDSGVTKQVIHNIYCNNCDHPERWSHITTLFNIYCKVKITINSTFKN